SRDLEANEQAQGNPLVHYLRHGGTKVPTQEGQHAADYELAGGDGGVDRAWYLQTYPDIERAGVDPVEHYLWTGWRERRDPRPDFSTSRYLEANKEAQGNPLLHYLRSAREAHWEEIAVTDWYRFWKKGLLRSIAEPEPKLAICNCADGWRLVKALREAGMPHLVSLVHERVVHYPPDVWRSIHQNSNRVIFPADAVKAATAAVLPDFQDASVVPQGLLKAEFGQGDRTAARIEVRRKLRLSSDIGIILGCGTQDMRKGIDLFVQLAAHVRARTTRDVHFLWLGVEQRDSLLSRFIDLDISLLNLSSTVSLLDEVTDPELYFLGADAFVLTSRDDPFPCVVHEAMACALPIVAFDGSGG